MRTCAIVVPVILAGTISAQPNVTFSFASDTQSSQSTFSSGGTVIQQFGRTGAQLELLADDANGPMPTLVFDTNFFADLSFDFVGSVALPSGAVSRVYSLDGTFSFADAVTGQTLLEAEISGGQISSLGTDDRWGSTASIEGSSLIGAKTSYTWLGDSVPGYALFSGVTSTFADATFTLSNIIDNTGAQGVGLGSASQLPLAGWSSEGSFSGSAFFVPTPASGVLLGLGGLAAVRRRRS